MKSTSIRRAIVPGTAVLALAISGCSAGNDNGGSGSGLSGTLNGGGSSAQEAAQGVWRAAFQTTNSGVTVNYDPVGSGTGRENFISKAYTFAGSDSALTTDAGELANAKKRCGGEDPIEVPAYVSPIAVVYNVAGIDTLQLSASTIAQIFDDKITTWDDPAIAAENPGVTLPSTTITPVHRSDDSGTTTNFTDYLSQAAGGDWGYDAAGVWPKTGGEAAEGTSGLVAAVGSGDGTIGYADDSQVGDLGVASIKVGSQYVAPSAEAAAKVLAISPRVEGRAAVDMAIQVDRTTTEAGAYPLLLASYLIACQHYDDANDAALVKGFLSYVVSTEGQQAAADQAGSAPLDSALQAEAAGIVDKIAAK
ncbi:phosphate ABC transporter substrate-binding protein PstS [Nocardioides sp.]|uniref:phosphate ABC transporter substrate-binding protein PstS n=1 Tax=Nocardioides sp. TaxID=35761 RepID=UPI0031FEE4DE|nr:pstS [Nocardioides sp.]